MKVPTKWRLDKNKMKLLRERMNLSQQNVADALSTTPAVISGFEIGYRQPSIDMLGRIIYFYDVDFRTIVKEKQ